MIGAIIAASVKNRVLVLIVTAMAALAGTWALTETPIDALPDLSDVQVIVFTEVPGQAPQIVEDQVTYPLTTALLSVPKAKHVRGYSFFGFSMVYVIFDDGTDMYWARGRVLEQLNVARARLPSAVTPTIGPDATGVGWVYMYSLSDVLLPAQVLRANFDNDRNGEVSDTELPRGDPRDEVYLTGLFHQTQLVGARQPLEFAKDAARDVVRAFDKDHEPGLSRTELLQAANYRGTDLSTLRSLQDNMLSFELAALDGVSEVAAVGGYVRQYQIEVDPEKLRAFSIPLSSVVRAVERSNVDVGGRLLEMGETEFMVRGQGYVASLEDLERIPVGIDEKAHAPILLAQVARVQLGPEIRRGLAEMNGEGEVVAGIVVMRAGENALEVIGRTKARLKELARVLPAGVVVHESYDRAQLIERAVSTLSRKLVEELVVVALICIVFLLHLRSALVAVITVPIGILVSLLVMKLLGISANIMSLGGIAIAIGVMVDASVVMVENLHKRRAEKPELAATAEGHKALVIRAATEVGPALFFSLLVITVSFLPVFTLGQQEGRLFSPLAFTKTFAMAGSAVLSITLVPVLMFLFVRGTARPEEKNPVTRTLIWVYRPILRLILRAPAVVLVVTALLGAATLYPWSKLGTEFMPPINEGDLLYMPTTPPGISITKAKELLQQTDKLIASHPQVEHVLGKIGRASTATDPAPLSMIETTIRLTSPETWPEGKRIEDIIDELDARVQFPGLTNSWTMPIKTRIDMLATGIKTPVGIKVMGDDLEVLGPVAERIEAVMRQMEGTQSAYAERVTGGNFVDVEVDRARAARFGLTVGDVQDVIKTALGGMNVSETVEGLARYPINIRYPRALRDDVQALARVAVPTPMGHTVPLEAVAKIKKSKGAPVIKSEDARQTAWVFVDLKTRDVGGFVEEAKAAVEREVSLPPGLSLVWSGQYEYMERANTRLLVVVPITLALIFIFLYLHFRSALETALVLATLPFALVGGVWLLYFAGYNLSIAVAVGFIALLGLAAETAVVMLVYLDDAYRHRQSDDDAGLLAAVMSGAVDRVRPKVMTVATTVIGLLPVMFGTETGTRVMKRIAAPMVGGLVSSTLLTLLILPAAYLLLRRLFPAASTPKDP